MMARLLAINRTAIDESLVGLSDYRIKRFGHVDVKEQISYRKAYGCFHPLNRSYIHFVFKKTRPKCHCFAEPL